MAACHNDAGAFYEAVARAGVVAKFNHPGRGANAFNELAYSEAGDRALQLMEVRNEPEEREYIRALSNGWHVAAEGSDDSHAPRWGNCGTWTGVLAPGLSSRNIWDALRNRRTYSTRDRNCALSFTVNGAVMGTIVEELARTVDVAVSVADDEEGDVIARIELFGDGVVVASDEPNTNSCVWTTTLSPEPGGHYYFTKVTQVDGDRLWSAPVWIEVGGM